MLNPRKLQRLAIAVSLAVGASSSMAQQLEEVIVTAQKRAENLQDVPISVSAVQGEQIQDATIFNMAAIADYVPNLHIADAAVNTNIYMRGIGSGNNRPLVNLINHLTCINPDGDPTWTHTFSSIDVDRDLAALPM